MFTRSDVDPDMGYRSDSTKVVGHCHPDTVNIGERDKAVAMTNIGGWEAELRPVGV